MDLTELLAQDLFEVVPLIMQAIRQDMRRERGHDLSVMQFRALAHIERKTSTAGMAALTLTALADHLGLTASSTSTLVEGLVEKGLVERRDCPEDRRRLSLQLTDAGRALTRHAREAARAALAIRVQAMRPEDTKILLQALKILRPLYEDTSAEIKNMEN